MDIFEEFHEMEREQGKREALNFPYGKLDYVQMGDDPNLYYAVIPEEQSVSLWDIFEYPAGGVLSLQDVRIYLPKIRREVELRYLLTLPNQVVGRVIKGQKKVQIAWQQWEKIYIEGEPQFRSKNWIAPGADSVPDVEPIVIDLDSETIRVLPRDVHCSDITIASDVAIAVISAMLEHQVNGDAIIKGLKSKADARFIDEDFTKFKLTPNYLGGWIIRGECNSTLTTSEFVEYVDRAVKSRL